MKHKFMIVSIAITLIFAVAGVGLWAFLTTANRKEYTIVEVIVQDELHNEIVDDNYVYSTKYLYLCTTDEGETIVFENEDILWLGKFNSSTILAQIKKFEKDGTPFKVTVVGFRVGFLTMYQNILKVEAL